MPSVNYRAMRAPFRLSATLEWFTQSMACQYSEAQVRNHPGVIGGMEARPANTIDGVDR